MGPSPPAEVTVRDAGPADARAVAQVHVASWRSAYAGLLPEAVLGGLSVDHRAARWGRLLDRSGPDRVLVAEQAGRIVGFASVGPTRDRDLGPETGQVGTLYVEPGIWGTGVGRSVLDAGLERLATAGYHRAVLWMLSTNERAAAFYRHRGWVADGRLRLQQFGGTVVLDRRLARPLPQILSRPSQ
jgi:GNAT superfamily N-acetyltransferase